MSRIPALHRPQIRQNQNPISGEIETVILDTAQTEFELCCHYIDGRLVKLSNGDAARVRAKLREWLGPDRDGQ